MIEPGTHTFVYAGERAAFRATPYDAQGEVLNGAGAISWWASDSTLVRIDSSGLAVAVREGQVRVSASLDGVTALARVGVSYGQARLRCTSCHGEGGAHGPGMFPGSSCSACHRAALDAPGAQHHERPDSGHAVVASGFGLQLPHDTLACTGCHQPGDGRPRYQPAGVEDCYACHRAQYDSATAIGKHLPGFPTTCTACHASTQWSGATFDHAPASQGRFTLVGAHLIKPCTACHDATSGVPLFIPADQNDCYTCHRAQYDSATAIGKHLPGFPTTCTGCHTTSQWPGATFDHASASQGRFTLVGAHLIKPCTACHDATSGVPLFIPADQNDCYTCHRAQYDSATAIGKHLPGFPTTCTGCHTTSQWPGATFDHDRQFFPVFSGTHRGAWSSCSTCHTVPTDYAQFSCLGCHEHAQAAMDQEHRGRSGYAYDSAACLRCHPRP